MLAKFPQAAGQLRYWRNRLSGRPNRLIEYKGPGDRMRIAYLTNQYPHVRHTFIRREVVALEAHGVEVVRFSVRDSGGDAVDPADRAEYGKTRALLAAGKAAAGRGACWATR